jgi:putative ABC transport system permease protein
MATLLSGIKHKWKTIAPSQPFNYAFLDDEFSHQYSAEERIGKISVSFSVLAILIASPIAYWTMHQWLEAFAYRVTINWQVFVLAGAAGLFIALVTTGCQAFRSALANPVQSLRGE